MVFNKIKSLFYKHSVKKNLLNKYSFTLKKKNKYPLSGFINYDYNYKPKTSFIFSHFVAEKTLLNSLRNLQSLRSEIEIIIINDKDSLSSNLNKSLKNSNDLIINTRDLGEVTAYKNGANVSRSSDYLIFCQDDDLIPLDFSWYQDCLEEFKKDKKLGLIGLNGGGFYNKSFQPINIGRIKKPPIKDYCSWLKFGPFIIRREVYFSIGGFKSFALIGETSNAVDQYLTIKVNKFGYKAMLLINDNTAKIRRRHNRDDGLLVKDLKKIKNRNLSFSDSQSRFLKFAKDDIKKIQTHSKIINSNLLDK
jgi:hypothetical protein